MRLLKDTVSCFGRVTYLTEKHMGHSRTLPSLTWNLGRVCAWRSGSGKCLFIEHLPQNKMGAIVFLPIKKEKLDSTILTICFMMSGVV